jgi:VCBS repeat-containing protein
VVLNAGTGAFTYTPTQVARQKAAAAATGADKADTFTVTVNDNDNDNDTITTNVTVTVAPSVDKPVAALPTVGVPNASTRVVTGTRGFTDRAAKPLIYTVSTKAGQGTVSVTSTGGLHLHPHHGHTASRWCHNDPGPRHVHRGRQEWARVHPRNRHRHSVPVASTCHRSSDRAAGRHPNSGTGCRRHLRGRHHAAPAPLLTRTRPLSPFSTPAALSPLKQSPIPRRALSCTNCRPMDITRAALNFLSCSTPTDLPTKPPTQPPARTQPHTSSPSCASHSRGRRNPCISMGFGLVANEGQAVRVGVTGSPLNPIAR